MTDNQEGLQSEPESPKVPNDGRPWLQLLLTEDGHMKVTGWHNDKIVAYGLLGMARDAIAENHLKGAKIERVNRGNLIDVVRRNWK